MNQKRMPAIDPYFVWPACLGIAGAVLVVGCAGFDAGAAAAGAALLVSAKKSAMS